ncbi:HNH endonuclease [Sinorhizobium meliloti]|uniref:HNH endonuclease n=1 Tax=Rhizobium meliloti TaxID=382 RepID=UPI00041B32F9|nr:HNH endonuclease [Sinorhizobium meliloti]
MRPSTQAIHAPKPPGKGVITSPPKTYNDVAAETFGPLDKYVPANDNAPQDESGASSGFGISAIEERIAAAFSYNPETGDITRLYGQHAGVVTTTWPNGYVRVNFEDQSYLGHRVAWLLQTGSWPEDEVDHINLVKDDNRWLNLREASRSDNLGNRAAYSNNKSGLKGAYFSKRLNKWQSFIQKGGKHKYLGLFATAEDAHAAYMAAANDNFGEFARGGAPVERVGQWMQTYTGRKFWPMDPRADEVFIEDIAHSLSLQCRYAGHCLRFYSVAEHSVHLARHLRWQGVDVALWALLHDASETYLVDVPRPVKPHLAGYKDAEAKVMAAVCERFGLAAEMPKQVHDADNRIIGDELVNLAPMEWHARYTDPLGVNIRCWYPEQAREEFLATFEALMDCRARGME